MWRRIKQKMLQQALVYMRPVLKPQTLQQPRYHSARVEAGFSPETYKWRDCLCAVVWFWWLAAALCQRCQRRRSLSLCFKPMTTKHGSAIWLKQYVDGQISYWGTVSTDLTVPCAVCFGVPFQSSCSTTSVPSRSMIGSVQTLNCSYIQPPSPHRNDKTCLAAKVSLWMHLAMPAVRFRLVHAVVWGPSMWS